MKYKQMIIGQACKKLAPPIKLQNKLGGHKCWVRRWHGAESGWECLVLWCLSRLKSVTWGWGKNRKWNFVGFQLVFHGTDLNPTVLANLPLFQQPWCTWVMSWTFTFWSHFWNGQQPNIELVALAGWSASTCSLLSWKSSGWRLVPLDRVAAREPTPLSTSPSSSRFPLQRKEIKLLHFNHCRLTCCVRRGECFPLENQFVLLVPTDLPPHLHVLFFH